MKTHIPLPSQSARRGFSPTEMLAILLEKLGRTDDTAWLSTATSDADEPDEPVVSQRDLDDRAEKDYERWLDQDSRRCA